MKKKIEHIIVITNEDIKPLHPLPSDATDKQRKRRIEGERWAASLRLQT